MLWGPPGVQTQGRGRKGSMCAGRGRAVCSCVNWQVPGGAGRVSQSWLQTSPFSPSLTSHKLGTSVPSLSPCPAMVSFSTSTPLPPCAGYSDSCPGPSSPWAPPLFSWRLACQLHASHPLQHLVPRAQNQTKVHLRSPCLN